MKMTEEFLNYLRYERNRSELTVSTYEQGLNSFEAYFLHRDSQLSWESVDSDIIRDWMESMMDKGDMASTVNNRLSAVRSFFRFALARKLVAKDPAYAVRGPKKQKPLPKFVREEEMNRLIDDVYSLSQDTYEDLRARTIIIILYETGIRLAELVALNDDDVDFVNHQLKVTGKRNKQRIVPFGPEMEATLKEYIRQRDEQGLRLEPAALILGNAGRRVSRTMVSNIVSRSLSLVTTQKKKSPHVLRHSFATAMLNHGAGLESVRKLLGHESVATTEIYTHTTFEQLKRVYENAHPRA